MSGRGKLRRAPISACQRRVRFGLWAGLGAVLLGWGCAPPSDSPPSLVKDGAPRRFLLDCANAGLRLVCVGERGTIALSDDNGQIWRDAAGPGARLLTAVYFADARRGWAVGHDGVILHSDDGGESWRSQYQLEAGGYPLFDVLFVDANRGLAVGAFGHAATTDDGGVTWTERVVVDPDAHLYALARAASGALFAVGEAGTVLRSDDMGRSWQAVAVPTKSSLFGVTAAADGALHAYGLQGTWLESRDEGASWRVARSPTRAAIQAFDASQAREPLLASSDGRVWNGAAVASGPVARNLDGVAHLRRLTDGHWLAVGVFGVKRLTLSLDGAASTP